MNARDLMSIVSVRPCKFWTIPFGGGPTQLGTIPFGERVDRLSLEPDTYMVKARSQEGEGAHEAECGIGRVGVGDWGAVRAAYFLLHPRSTNRIKRR